MDKQIKKEIRRISNANSLTLLLFYTILLTLITIASVGMYLFLDDENPNFNYIVNIVSYIIQYVVTVPLVILIFYGIRGRKTNQRLKDVFVKPKMPAGWIAKWMIISIGVTYFSSYVSSLFFEIIQQLTGQEFYSPEIVADDALLSKISNILAIVFLAPFFEEILFRGTIARNTEKMGQTLTIIITGLTFGLWHLNYEQTIYTAVMGMFACYLFLKTKSIFIPILLHFIFNSIGGLQSILLPNVNLEEDDNLFDILNPSYIILSLLSLIIICTMIAGIVLFIIELCLNSKKSQTTELPVKQYKFQKFIVYITSPLTVIALILSIGYTVFVALS